MAVVQPVALSRTAQHPDRVKQCYRIARVCVPVIFFSAFFVFLLLYVHPEEIYSSNGLNIHNYVTSVHAQEKSPQHIVSYPDPLFRRQFILELTPEYLRDVIVTPGGWTRLAVTLCIYTCHNSLIGAIAITGLAIFFYWIFLLFIQGFGGRRLYIAGYIPSFLLMTICAWYELSDCTFLLPVAGALASAVFYQRLRPDGTVNRMLWISLLFWVTWYLMQWGSLLFLLFIIIYELFNRKKKCISVMYIAAVNVAILYIVDTWLFPVKMMIHWSNFTELSALPLVFIGIFPLTAILTGLFGRYRDKMAYTVTFTGTIVQLSLLLCCTFVTIFWLLRETGNRDTRTIARTVYNVMNGKWEAILDEKTTALFADFPQKAGPLQEFMMHAVNHALCRTNRAGDNLFSYPQEMLSDDPLSMFEITQTRGYVNWVLAMNIAMDLGMVSTAEKLAGEIMENVGPYPDIIYRRALIQIAKDNRQAAAVYLNKLACMPFYGTEAKRLLRIRGNDNAIMAEPRIALMHADMDTSDYCLFTVSYETTLMKLLQSNPGNKMAFDYLMNYYVLSCKVNGIAEFAPRASSLGYTVLPRCWEQALCVYLAMTSLWSNSGASFPGISQITTNYFNEFSHAYDKLSGDPSIASKLAPSFGDSYFYFSTYRFSPGVRHE